MKAIRNRAMWAFALIIFAYEVFDYASAGLVAFSATSDFLFRSIVRLATVSVILALTFRVDFRKSLQPMASVASVLGVFGCLLLIAGNSVDVPALPLMGYVLIEFSLETILIALFVLISTMSFASGLQTMVGGRVVSAFLVPLYALNPYWATIACAAGIIGSALLMVGATNDKTLFFQVDDAAKQDFKAPAPMLVLAFVMISLFFGVAITTTADASAEWLTFTSAAKLLAVGIFVLVMNRTADLGQSQLFKIVASLVVASAICSIAHLGAHADAALSVLGYELLDVACQFMIVNLMSHLRTSPAKVFGGYLLFVYGSFTVGSFLAPILQSQSFGGITAAVVVTVLAVCSIWGFDDKTVSEFFWAQGGDSGEPGEAVVADGQTEVADAHASEGEAEKAVLFPDRVTRVANAYGLSSRETEVLALFAQGRSAVFIAEELYISASTVRTHVKHIYEKCNLHSRQELITLMETQRPSS